MFSLTAAQARTSRIELTKTFQTVTQESKLWGRTSRNIVTPFFQRGASQVHKIVQGPPKLSKLPLLSC